MQRSARKSKNYKYHEQNSNRKKSSRDSYRRVQSAINMRSDYEKFRERSNEIDMSQKKSRDMLQNVARIVEEHQVAIETEKMNMAKNQRVTLRQKESEIKHYDKLKKQAQKSRANKPLTQTFIPGTKPMYNNLRMKSSSPSRSSGRKSLRMKNMDLECSPQRPNIVEMDRRGHMAEEYTFQRNDSP